ncbi:MAG: hypothetical protein IJI34_10735 [Clostridia bacterium]|nr:hypothetical protein [Clostridia bacterium]
MQRKKRRDRRFFHVFHARSILANEPVGADIIRPPQSNDSPAGESSFMRAAQFMTKSIHPRKAFRFSACPPHPAPLTLCHLPLKGKAFGS